MALMMMLLLLWFARSMGRTYGDGQAFSAALRFVSHRVPAKAKAKRGSSERAIFGHNCTIPRRKY